MNILFIYKKKKNRYHIIWKVIANTFSNNTSFVPNYVSHEDIVEKNISTQFFVNILVKREFKSLGAHFIFEYKVI